MFVIEACLKFINQVFSDYVLSNTKQVMKNQNTPNARFDLKNRRLWEILNIS